MTNYNRRIFSSACVVCLSILGVFLLDVSSAGSTDVSTIRQAAERLLQVDGDAERSIASEFLQGQEPLQTAQAIGAVLEQQYMISGDQNREGVREAYRILRECTSGSGPAITRDRLIYRVL